MSQPPVTAVTTDMEINPGRIGMEKGEWTVLWSWWLAGLVVALERDVTVLWSASVQAASQSLNTGYNCSFLAISYILVVPLPTQFL